MFVEEGVLDEGEVGNSENFVPEVVDGGALFDTAHFLVQFIPVSVETGCFAEFDVDGMTVEVENEERAAFATEKWADEVSRNDAGKDDDSCACSPCKAITDFNDRRIDADQRPHGPDERREVDVPSGIDFGEEPREAREPGDFYARRRHGAIAVEEVAVAVTRRDAGVDGVERDGDVEQLTEEQGHFCLRKTW